MIQNRYLIFFPRVLIHNDSDGDGISDLSDLYPTGSGIVRATFTRLHLLDNEYDDGWPNDVDGELVRCTLLLLQSTARTITINDYENNWG